MSILQLLSFLRGIFEKFIFIRSSFYNKSAQYASQPAPPNETSIIDPRERMDIARIHSNIYDDISLRAYPFQLIPLKGWINFFSRGHFYVTGIYKQVRSILY